jgi:hypothetical protein
LERVSTDSLPRSTQHLNSLLLPPSRSARSALRTSGSAPAIKSRLAFRSRSTSTACSIRPLPPVSTTAASVGWADACAGLPSVKANSTKPIA